MRGQKWEEPPNNAALQQVLMSSMIFPIFFPLHMFPNTMDHKFRNLTEERQN